MKIWNEIVQAYEEQMAVLEAAREEYARACKAVIEEVVRKVREEVQNWDVPAHVHSVVEITDEEGVGQCEAEIHLREGDLPWVRLYAWVASAHGGAPKKLQVGVFVEERSGEVLVSTEQMRQRVREKLGSDASPRGEDIDECTVVHRSLDIEAEDVTTQAVALLRGYVSSLRPLIEEWSKEEQPLRALLDAKRSLLGKSVVSKQVVSPKRSGLNHKGKYHYLWLSDPKPSVWIGYDAELEAMILAHDEVEDDEGLTQRVAVKIGGKVTKHHDYPAIRLGTRNQMRKLDHQEIVDMILDAFRRYHELAH